MSDIGEITKLLEELASEGGSGRERRWERRHLAGWGTEVLPQLLAIDTLSIAERLEQIPRLSGLRMVWAEGRGECGGEAF